MPHYSILKPAKQKGNNRKIYGFDIETYDKNRKFLLASIWGEHFKKTYFDKDSLINDLKQKKFHNSYIAATNLSFDFFGTFHNRPEIAFFNTLFRGSSLLYAKTYIKNKGFKREWSNNSKPLTFIDTGNYAGLSVEKLGKIINIPKFEKPGFLGEYPKSRNEWDIMIQYNMRDSEISAKALNYFFDSFYKMGASIKPTIASTSMSLFKNRYLKEDYFRHPVPVLDEIFKGYYGGRTEVFERGLFHNLNYYDVNSMYPYVMREYEYPDPNSLRITYKEDIDYIHSFEGMSNVSISAPYNEYPLLPVRFDNKLIFPYGMFSGWYTHIELRRAMELGYTITKIRKIIYYRDKCRPFKEFVDELYKKRMDYKEKNNPMEFTAKILLNSLYGKFGQKFRDKDNWVPIPPTIEELDKIDFYEREGEYIRIKQAFREPAAFTIPIWAAYVTAYARILLQRLISRAGAVYCDTDSIVTRKKLITGSGLGELKLEAVLNEAVFIKPKMYAFKSSNSSTVKIKGLGVKIGYHQFISEFIKRRAWDYTKFLKFKEALRRDMLPNEIVKMVKAFGLNDDKRVWSGEFSLEHDISRPHKFMDTVTEARYKEDMEKAVKWNNRVKEKEMEKFISSDLFDREAVGKDISYKEFLDNETDINFL